MTRSAPATRGDTVTLVLGPLVQFDVTLYNKTDKHGVDQSRYSLLTGNPVGNLNYDKVTHDTLGSDLVVTKVNTEHGPVFVEDHEIEALFDLDPSSMKVLAYQPASLFGTTYVPKHPYSIEVAPQKKGSKKLPNVGGQQALAALLQILEDEDLIAVCEITTRGKPKPAVLLPDGTTWYVYYEQELREERPKPDVAVDPAAKEQLKSLFVAPNIKTEPLDLTDVRTERIHEFAAAKAAAGEFGAPAAPELVESTSLPSTNDLMAMLNASIAAAAQ